MGVVPSEGLDQIYDAIRAAATTVNGVSCLIFVSPDPDALCACKLLTTLLKADTVPHETIPVVGYTDLARINRQLIEPNDALRSIVMLNCGGLVDLSEIISIGEQVRVYVLDYHRPMNLHNLYGHPQVVVAIDLTEHDKTVQEAYEALEYASLSEDDDGDGDEDDDNEDDRASEEGDQSDDEDELTGAPKDLSDAQKLARSRRLVMGDDNDSDAHENESAESALPAASLPNKDKGEGDEADDDDDDDDDDGPATGPSRMAKRKRLSRRADNSDSEEDLGHATKRRRERRQQLRQQRVVKDYYAHTTQYGESVSTLMYRMTDQLGRTRSKELLWLAIVGMTHLWINHRMTPSRYKDNIDYFTEHIELTARVPVAATTTATVATPTAITDTAGLPSLSQDDPLAGDMASVFGAEDDENAEGDSKPRPMTAADLANHRRADADAIVPEDAFFLAMYRHWALYDALYHSSYIATKLGSWRDKGQSRLHRFLLQMGMPLKESLQLYSEMDIKYRRSLPEKLLSVAARYNLDEIVFPSFHRQNGYKSVIGASDAVYALSALLAGGAYHLAKWASGQQDSLSAQAFGGPKIVTASQGGRGPMTTAQASSENFGGLVGVGAATRTGHQVTRNYDFSIALRANALHRAKAAAAAARRHGAGGADDADAADAAEEDEEANTSRLWVQNFYVAYDALTNTELLYSGIQLAMQFQRAMVQTGVTILDRHLVKTLKHFRFAILQHNMTLVRMQGDSQIAPTAVILEQLAEFLIAAYREFKSKKDLPLVLAAPNETGDTYLVLGTTAKTMSSRRNPFGLAFQLAANQLSAQVKQDTFETCLMQIPAEDLEAFMETLQVHINR